jgi:hypothetical protein
MRDPDSPPARDDYRPGSAAASKPDSGVGEAQRETLGREGELASRACDRNPVRGGTSLGPQRRCLTPWTDGQSQSIDREYRDQALRYRHQSSSPVGRGDVTCGGGDLDPIQGCREPGYCDAEKHARKCKNQQQLGESERPSHDAKLGEFPREVAPFL